MWRTPEGDRILQGPEAALFLFALSDLAIALKIDEGDYATGVPVFDRCSFGQRVALLEDVATALLREEVPTPEHTASNEAAIFAVFTHLRDLLEDELAVGKGCDTRTLIHKAAEDIGCEFVPLPSDRGTENWNSCIEALIDQILWDRDFEDGEMFVDSPMGEADPEDTGEIVHDYFSDIPRDPPEKEFSELLERVSKLSSNSSHNAEGCR